MIAGFPDLATSAAALAPRPALPGVEAPSAAEGAPAAESASAGAGPEGEADRSGSVDRSSQETVDGLTPEERRIVAELRRIDRQVRAHEQAHLAAAGSLASGVSFTFVTGPDGRQYAVAGEVRLDTSPVAGDPEATIEKAQQIRAAANAPANPSAQDRAVAAQATQMEIAARAELAAEERQEQAERREETDQRNRSDQAAQFSGGGAAVTGALFSAVA